MLAGLASAALALNAFRTLSRVKPIASDDTWLASHGTGGSGSGRTGCADHQSWDGMMQVPHRMPLLSKQHRYNRPPKIVSPCHLQARCESEPQ